MIEGEHGVRACCGVLSRTAQALSSALQEQEIIATLLEQIVPVFGARAAAVRLLSPDGDELLLAGAKGLSDAYLEKGHVTVPGSRVDERVLAGEVVVVRDVTREPDFQYPDAAAGEGLRGMVSAPLSVRGRVIGVFRVYVDDVDKLSTDDLVLLDILTDLGALALEKVRIHESLYVIAEALNSTLELRPMLRKVLEATVDKMRLKAATVRLRSPNDQILHLAAAYGLSESYLEKGDIHLNRSSIDQRALRGETVVLEDVRGEAGLEYPEEAAREGIRSVVAVPLKFKDKVLGVLRVYSMRPRGSGDLDTKFLISVADLVALAIENAELYGALRSRYEDLKVDLADWYRFLALG